MTKATADLLQGTLDMLILKALSLGALHGYGIIQRIRQMSDEMLSVEQGSLYPALYRIEQRGWVSSDWDTNETGRLQVLLAVRLDRVDRRYRRLQRHGLIRRPSSVPLSWP